MALLDRFDQHAFHQEHRPRIVHQGFVGDLHYPAIEIYVRLEVGPLFGDWADGRGQVLNSADNVGIRDVIEDMLEGQRLLQEFPDFLLDYFSRFFLHHLKFDVFAISIVGEPDFVDGELREIYRHLRPEIIRFDTGYPLGFIPELYIEVHIADDIPEVLFQLDAGYTSFPLDRTRGPIPELKHTEDIDDIRIGCHGLFLAVGNRRIQ